MFKNDTSPKQNRTFVKEMLFETEKALNASSNENMANMIIATTGSAIEVRIINETDKSDIEG